VEKQILSDPELHNAMTIDTCVENVSGALLKFLVASTLNCLPRNDPRPPIPATIHDEIRQKNRMRKQWQITRDPGLRAEINRLKISVIHRLN